MQTLAIATSDSSAGNLKVARVADRVECLNWQLHGWPAPASPRVTHFFAQRAKAVREDPELASWDWTTEVYGRCHRGRLIKRIASNHVEFWIDPDPNAQLQLVLLLTMIMESKHTTSQIVLRHCPLRLGEQKPAWARCCAPPAVQLEDRHLQLASRVWATFTAPDPRGWAALLNDDLSDLPWLKAAVWIILCGLPSAATGLSDVEAAILWALRDGSTANALFAMLVREHGHVAVGMALIRLGRGHRPAIAGVSEEEFKFDWHDDAARRRRFQNAPLHLTEFGHELVNGDTDYACHNVIGRWWGGTRLTNAGLWRWDDETASLIAPS